MQATLKATTMQTTLGLSINVTSGITYSGLGSTLEATAAWAVTVTRDKILAVRDQLRQAIPAIVFQPIPPVATQATFQDLVTTRWLLANLPPALGNKTGGMATMENCATAATQTGATAIVTLDMGLGSGPQTYYLGPAGCPYYTAQQLLDRWASEDQLIGSAAVPRGTITQDLPSTTTPTSGSWQIVTSQGVTTGYTGQVVATV
jgi:hypothetical protein